MAANGNELVTLSQLKTSNIPPVGYVYISYTSTSPASIYGGSWTELKGVFPYFNHGTTASGSNSHTHGLSNGAAMIDVSLAPEGAAMIFAKTNATYRWNTDGTPQPGAKRFILGSVGAAGEDLTGNYLTKLYGNSNSASNLPKYQTLYAWRRTA